MESSCTKRIRPQNMATRNLPLVLSSGCTSTARAVLPDLVGGGSSPKWMWRYQRTRSIDRTLLGGGANE